MRKRYYAYHFAGMGIERVTLSLDLTVGIYTHAILADVLNMLRQRRFDDVKLQEIIACGCRMFDQEVRQRGLALELASGYEQDEAGKINVQAPTIDFTIQLYSAWMRNSVTAWCAIRAPYYVQNYDIIEVEKEEEMMLDNQRLLFLARTDAVLRRHTDGELFVLNFKTVGEPNDWWREQWRHDMQTLTEMLPIEARLGQRVSGVLIEGLVKGKKNIQYPKDSGQWWSNSPFCWAWVKPGQAPFPSEYAAKYEWIDQATGYTRRLGKGFTRTPIWNDTIGVQGWLQWLYENAHDVVEQQFIGLPPILRSQPEIDQWLRQNTVRELAIHEMADATKVSQGEDHQNMLDWCFPMSTSGGNCIRPSKCPFYDLCWGAGTADERLGSGEFMLRQPNHPKEAEVHNGNTR